MVAAATEQARQLTSQIANARTALGELTGTLAALNVEGSAEKAHAIGEDTETLASDAAGLTESLQQVQGRVEVLRGLLTASTKPVSAAASASPAASSDHPTETAPFDPQPYFDEMPVMQRKRDLDFGKTQDRTHGRWHGAVKTGVSADREWVSGEDDRFARSAQARWEREQPGPKRTKTFALAGHVEVKFAEYMREKGLKNERIVINNPDGPCPLPMGCERYMSWILEPGSSLTVVYPGGERTFVGTGSIA